MTCTCVQRSEDNLCHFQRLSTFLLLRQDLLVAWSTKNNPGWVLSKPQGPVHPYLHSKCCYVQFFYMFSGDQLQVLKLSRQALIACPYHFERVLRNRRNWLEEDISRLLAMKGRQVYVINVCSLQLEWPHNGRPLLRKYWARRLSGKTHPCRTYTSQVSISNDLRESILQPPGLKDNDASLWLKEEDSLSAGSLLKP